MKTTNKLLLLFSILSLQFGLAQEKIQIMVLGTSHQNEVSDSTYQKKIIEKLKAFHPDMVFGEFVRPEDYLKLDPEGFRRKTNDKSFDYINYLNPGIKSSDKQIHTIQKQLALFGNFHKERINLAVDYLKNYDLANGSYQIFILNKYKAAYFGNEETIYFKERLGVKDSLQNKGLYSNTNEYSTIIFPMMYELKLPEIYSMDCQNYDMQWTNSWRLVAYIMHYIEKVAKLDPNSEEAKIVKKKEEVLAEVQNETEKSKLWGYAYNNSELNARQSDIINFYCGEALFGFSKDYPEKFVKEMMKYWKLRNEGMANNTMMQIRKKGAKKIILAVGSAHQKAIADLLAKEKDVEIITFE